MTHKLKILSKYFNDILSRKKTFEVRFDDRDYKENDKLLFREIDEINYDYTGREVCVDVLYVLRGDYCKTGYCIMSIQLPPLPVEYEADGYDDEGHLIYDKAYCPCCRQEYEVDYDNHDNYCRNCGQKLSWNVAYLPELPEDGEKNE